MKCKIENLYSNHKQVCPLIRQKNDLYRKKYQYFRFDHWHELYIKFVTAFVQLIIKQRLLKLSCTLKNVQYVHFGICISSTFYCKTVVLNYSTFAVSKGCILIYNSNIMYNRAPKKKKKSQYKIMCSYPHHKYIQ